MRAGGEGGRRRGYRDTALFVCVCVLQESVIEYVRVEVEDAAGRRRRPIENGRIHNLECREVDVSLFAREFPSEWLALDELDVLNDGTGFGTYVQEIDARWYRIEVIDAEREGPEAEGFAFEFDLIERMGLDWLLLEPEVRDEAVETERREVELHLELFLGEGHRHMKRNELGSR